MTAVQSSSLMRTSSPSRVMPALLTTMSSPPSSAIATSTSAAGRVGVAHVGLQGDRACRPPRSIFVDDAFGRGRGAGVVDGDRGAVRGQLQRDGRTDAARRAGDQRDLAGQVRHQREPPRRSSLDADDSTRDRGDAVDALGETGEHVAGTGLDRA